MHQPADDLQRVALWQLNESFKELLAVETEIQHRAHQARISGRRLLPKPAQDSFEQARRMPFVADLPQASTAAGDDYEWPSVLGRGLVARTAAKLSLFSACPGSGPRLVTREPDPPKESTAIT